MTLQALELYGLAGTQTIVIQITVAGTRDEPRKHSTARRHNGWLSTGTGHRELYWFGPWTMVGVLAVAWFGKFKNKGKSPNGLRFRTACIHRSNLCAFAVASCLLRLRAYCATVPIYTLSIGYGHWSVDRAPHEPLLRTPKWGYIMDDPGPSSDSPGR